MLVFTASWCESLRRRPPRGGARGRRARRCDRRCSGSSPRTTREPALELRGGARPRSSRRRRRRARLAELRGARAARGRPRRARREGPARLARRRRRERAVAPARGAARTGAAVSRRRGGASSSPRCSSRRGCAGGGARHAETHIRLVVADKNIRREGVECAGARPFQHVHAEARYTDRGRGRRRRRGGRAPGRARGERRARDRLGACERIPTFCVIDFEVDLPERPRYRLRLDRGRPLEFARARATSRSCSSSAEPPPGAEPQNPHKTHAAPSRDGCRLSSWSRTSRGASSRRSSRLSPQPSSPR